MKIKITRKSMKVFFASSEPRLQNGAYIETPDWAPDEDYVENSNEQKLLHES